MRKYLFNYLFIFCLVSVVSNVVLYKMYTNEKNKVSTVLKGGVVKEIIRSDTVYIIHEPEIKTVKTTYTVVSSESKKDSIIFEQSKDSIEVFLSTFRKMLYNNETFAIKDSIKFPSGDSLFITVKFWPLNEIEYRFFPRPDIVVKNERIKYISVRKLRLLTSILTGYDTGGRYPYACVSIGVTFKNDVHCGFFIGKNLDLGRNVYGVTIGKSITF